MTFENGGGSGTWMKLQAVLNHEGKAFMLEPYDFGDRQGPDSIIVGSDRVITATGLSSGPGDPSCCPSLKTIWKFRVEGEKLVKISEEHVGTKIW